MMLWVDSEDSFTIYEERGVDLKKYIGVKIVHAEPCSLGEAEDCLNRAVGGPNGKREDEGYLVVYPDQYESWCPKEQFEISNRLTEGMPFGLALECMKEGKSVCRKGWNSKSMWLCRQKPDEDSKMTASYIYLTMSHGDHAGAWRFPWQPSAIDLFAEDWEII